MSTRREVGEKDPPKPPVKEPIVNPSKKLPLKALPGSYGLPFIGAIWDRFDYFYNQGRDEFFKSRIKKYKSTVFRTNMPPGPFNASNPRVVAVLDAISFSILFDTSKVEKRDVFTGTYMPSLHFTGGHRVCAYLDPSEDKHDKVKRFLSSLLSSRKDEVLPLLTRYLRDLFLHLGDKVIKHDRHAHFNSISDNELFKFVFRLYCGKEPDQTKLGSFTQKLFELWVLPQVAPLGSLELPWFFFPINVVEDFFLHTLPFPGWLLKWNQKKLYNVINTSATEALDLASKFGLSREEACNNLLFVLGFNTYGGVKIVFPTLMKYVGLAGKSLHKRLAEEIRRVVKEERDEVTLGALEKMKLVKSVVWEVLRIEPPVPYQYGKAKEDVVIKSHNAAFVVKKGEMIFGYQPFATRDPKVFENPRQFVGDRFVGEGEKLLKYVYWSNGRETENPTAENKQCPGKDLVVLMLRVFLVEFFLTFDTFAVELGKPTLGPSVTIKSLVMASSL